MLYHKEESPPPTSDLPLDRIIEIHTHEVIHFLSVAKTMSFIQINPHSLIP